MNNVFYSLLIINIILHCVVFLYGIKVFRLAKNLNESLKFSAKILISLISISILYFIGIQIDWLFELQAITNEKIPRIKDLIYLTYEFIQLFVYFYSYYYIKIFITDKYVCQYELHQVMKTLMQMKEYINKIEKSKNTPNE